MKNKILTISFFVISALAFWECQKSNVKQEAETSLPEISSKPYNIDELKGFEGVWIEENYLKDFVQTKSPFLSRDKFDYDLPVGIRIHLKDKMGDSLYIGYSTLHSHMDNEERAGYFNPFEDGNDENIKPFESSAFCILLSSKSVEGLKFQCTMIPFFSEEPRMGYLDFQTLSTQNRIVLTSIGKNKKVENTVIYKRISSTFSDDYQDPNPLYFLYRKEMLANNYELFDSNNVLLSDNLRLKLNGTIEGFKPLESYKYFINSEYYCGPLNKIDLVNMYPDSFNIYSRSYKGGVGYGLIMSDSSVELRDIVYNDKNGEVSAGKLAFKLRKSN